MNKINKNFKKHSSEYLSMIKLIMYKFRAFLIQPMKNPSMAYNENNKENGEEGDNESTGGVDGGGGIAWSVFVEVFVFYYG